MSDTDPDLDRLQDLLNGIPVERDGMTVAELDGCVAALIVCPDMILPSEWLPEVWGIVLRSPCWFPLRSRPREGDGVGEPPQAL